MTGRSDLGILCCLLVWTLCSTAIQEEGFTAIFLPCINVSVPMYGMHYPSPSYFCCFEIKFPNEVPVGF